MAKVKFQGNNTRHWVSTLPKQTEHKNKNVKFTKKKLHGKTIKFFGPPGTGKTHRLLQRAKRFLRRGVLPDEICYISFTNKAVQECLDRVRKEFKGYDEDDFKYFRTLT